MGGFCFSVTIIIQKPSENRTSLVFKWSKVVRFANGPVFEWLGCLISIFILRNCHSYVLPFEIRTGIQMVQPIECSGV